jgi:hypothetical protein
VPTVVIVAVPNVLVWNVSTAYVGTVPNECSFHVPTANLWGVLTDGGVRAQKVMGSVRTGVM